MMFREMLFQPDARRRILDGVDALADAIRLTLGPKSRSVLIEREYGVPLVCNDGVTIAREARWKDPVANMGAQLLRQAAERTADAVGDGTSTSCVLARALFADGVRNVAAGAGALDWKRGMEKAVASAVAALRAQARPVVTHLEKQQVAAIAAHNDNAMGELVAEAMDKAGVDGVISVEESRTTDTTLVVVEGMQFDRGYLSPYFITDAAKMEVVLEQPCILLCNHKLSVLPPLVPLLEELAKAARPLLVIAEEVEGDVMATLVLNQLRSVLRSCAVKAPGYGEQRLAVLQDIAALSGAIVVGDVAGMRLEDVRMEHLGRAERVVVRKDSTTLVAGSGDRAVIDARIAQLRTQMSETQPGYERTQLEKRLARLAGGIALIRVGAAVESEMRAKRDALDDAIAATHAAVQEGIVPGGGLALLRCIPALAAAESALEGDERAGFASVRRALQAPARQIAENSEVDAGVVVAEMMASQGAMGFDAVAKRQCDLMAAGIIDPARVVRVALENAAAVAGLLLLAEAVMVRVEEPVLGRATPVEDA